jgi:predicted DNA-binding transcriptional regulator AlpA
VRPCESEHVQTHKRNPDANAGQFKPLATENATLEAYGDKGDVAAMLNLSRRSVDNLLRQGCPHLRLGTRRVRFDMPEVRQWLAENFRTQRRGPANTGK